MKVGFLYDNFERKAVAITKVGYPLLVQVQFTSDDDEY